MLDNNIWKVSGQEQGSDTAGRIFGNFIVTVVGISCIWAGIAIVYSAITGND
jgi:hypothetical protein